MSQSVSSQSPTTLETVTERLKSERVQEMLAAMPAWAPVPLGEAIGRAYQFPSARVAWAFARYIWAYAKEEGHNVYLDVSNGEVVLTVAGAKAKGRAGDLTEEIVAFARKLG